MRHHWLAIYIGNRGVVLALLGIICIVIGIGYLTDPPVDVGLPDERFPGVLRVLLWIVPGVFALLSTIWRRGDEWAWPLLIVPFAVRFLAYGWVLITQLWQLLFGWTAASQTAAWRGACLYLALGLLIDRCAAGLDRCGPWSAPAAGSDDADGVAWKPPV